jgi:hypothetical protein
MSAPAPALLGALAAPRPAHAIDVAPTPETLAWLEDRDEPVILRSLVGDWPAVSAARTSPQAVHDYLAGFDCGAKVPVCAGLPELQGRIFYNDDFTGLNIDRGTAQFATFIRRVLDHGGAPDPALVYLASMDIETCLPGFRARNDVDFAEADPLASIWIGTRTRIAAHNDLPLNLACVVSGARRFTLFPPDQTANLYPGPFELTPAGRPISLVDFHAPDLDRFPRFAAAMETAQVADLEPGDALFIPSMWWHHVEASGPFNILVNYWWRTVARHLGTPQDVLNHAMMTLRDLPERERRIWKDLFDHYVFERDEHVRAHIPEHARGILAPMTADMARRVRAFLLNRLNR